MIYLKIHNTDNGNIIAMCDEELINKILKEDKIELDLQKYAGFYKGELLDEISVKKLMKDTDFFSANIIGKNSIRIMENINLIDSKDIKIVENVPFVQIYKII
jgi:hypothetical protein